MMLPTEHAPGHAAFALVGGPHDGETIPMPTDAQACRLPRCGHMHEYERDGETLVMRWARSEARPTRRGRFG